ncbi:3-phosphoshikimate 1-carboxyvinyltransferase [Aliidiomarina sedimenti]|uniref:3-phosphoshikimate 1-carboxyvinyltransferase n=1 Tax=Aliidiomarina sedimenti TaxID=1933879 RepID=A0ABY0C1L1_9GAMM|nr:3-phosphoshikimate 1-carboxyvinyltransferase [Aliidiomarina sedimenti]RUO31709.1 3-phosphoshikimate 1-carboxyvinyltransferase [Aliidiomarina sedimenti]
MNTLKLDPQRLASGKVRLPGSKSMANRALLLSALASGTTRLRNMLDSDDTRYMRRALIQLGVGLREQTLDGELVIEVDGLGRLFQCSESQQLHLGNAGTAMRPLAAALAFSQGDYVLTGDKRMFERPIGPLIEALTAMGADIEYQQNEGYPPLLVHGQAFSGGSVCIDGSLSSQFITALLMVLPFNQVATHVTLTGELVSLPYIELTLAMMERFGVVVERISDREFMVPATGGYQSSGEFLIEGDASSASYFLAAAAIAGGTVRVEGTGQKSLQGDIAFASVLQQMGAKVTWGDDFIEVEKGRLEGGQFDLNAIPDAAMTIATTALFAAGATEIRNVYNWRLKETDRLAAMATELRKTGAEVEEGEDYLRIVPPTTIKHAQIATYDDHRMAMCFALLAFAPAGVEIEDPACCAKTYPDFFQDFAKICHL